jgi:hypothetical protein
MPLVFDQQPNESNKAYAAFSAYLNLGPERSLAAAAKVVGKTKWLLERWSARHQWVDRVRAHDEHMVQQERKVTEALTQAKAVDWLKRQTALREAEWRIHEELLAAGREALKRFYERGHGANLGDVARLLELASKLGRLATGMATDKTEVTGEDGGPIRVELEAALKKIYGPPHPQPTQAEVIDIQATQLPGRDAVPSDPDHHALR